MEAVGVETIQFAPPAKITYVSQTENRHNRPTWPSSSRPLPRSEGEELIRVVRDAMENPDLRVKVACVVTGWADASIESGLESSPEESPPSNQ